MSDSIPVFSEHGVELGDDDLIGEGSRRYCYRYPGQPTLCIKIPMRKKNGLLQQRREVRYYASLHKRGVPTDRITGFHGTVDTNLGTGFVYDAIRDPDGRPSRQMMFYLREHPEHYREYLRILRVLEDYLFDNRVIIYDLSAYNILCRRTIDGGFEPFIIDGVGDVVAIPVFNLSKRLVLRKIERRWMRMINTLARRYDWMAGYRFNH